MKRIAFDLDDVICKHDSKYDSLGPLKYNYCLPIEKNIELVNALHNSGYEILIYTARGMSEYKGNLNLIYENLYDLTYKCLVSWGVKFDRLVMGKLNYDVLIDDKVINSAKITKEEIINFLK